MLSKDEFIKKFRGDMLLFLTDAWACRHSPPSELGMIMDEHSRRLKGLLEEMYAALVPEVKPAVNGPLRKGMP